MEFLLGVDGTISFLEVNTRLQVEHPVTEETTGIDLVIEQFRIAEGKTLRVLETPEPRGHSMEFRINAEDPGRGFLPTPGTITVFDPPSGPGVRLDSGVVSGSSVPGVFDSLMAKLIVTGEDRRQVLQRARRALKEFRIEGVATVLPFHRAALEAKDFTGEDAFKAHTRWIETDFAAMPDAIERPAQTDDASIHRTYLEIDGKRVSVGSVGGGAPASASGTATKNDGEIAAPVSGTLQSFKVEDGQTVSEGDLVAVMEAMKMETQILATKGGTIHLLVKEGAYLQAGHALMTID